MDNRLAAQVPITKKEQSARVMLTQALYKIGYCICIPDCGEIDLNSQQVNSNWLSLLLLQKNLKGESILVRLLNLAFHNHTLTQEQFSRLFDLIYFLLNKLPSKQIGGLLNEVHGGHLSIIYNFLYQVSMTQHLTRVEHQSHQLWSRTPSFVNSLRFFLYSADTVSLDQFFGYSAYGSFLLLKELLRHISNPLTSQPGLNLFILSAEKLIDHFPQPNFDKKLQEYGA